MIATPAPSRFELRRFLGRGALGDVYLAWDPKRGQEVALKLVRTAAVPPDMLEAEKNGALLQQRLATVAPQVPGVFDFGEEGEVFWISMEYVEGVDLAEAMEKEAISELRAVGITIELCRFLSELHGLRTEIGGRTIRGIVHGDIKPQNLRLQAGDRVRVLDFGVARQLSLSRSFTQQPFGSLPYVSPERLETGDVDRLSDLWSVGVLLYGMVAGYLPFDGTAPADVEHNIHRGARRPLPASCSPQLRAILDRCLHLEARQRYPSAAFLQQELEAFLEGRSIAPRTQETTQATRRTLAPRPRASAAPRPPRPVKPGRSKAGGGLLIVLGLLATFGACQGYVRMEARHLRQDLGNASGLEVSSLWERFQGLHRLDFLGLVPSDLRNDMRAALLRAADRILSRDLNVSASREEWEATRSDLEAALEIDRTDVLTRSKLAYCRAQVALAEAASLRETGEPAAAAGHEEDALAELAEAARLDGTWAQPHVIRARIYGGRDPVDLARMEAEIAAAQERGYPKDRLILSRADGHHAEAQRLYSEAVRARGSDRERELLARAIEGFSRAIDLYDQVPADLQSESSREMAVRNRRALEDRYAALSLPW